MNENACDAAAENSDPETERFFSDAHKNLQRSILDHGAPLVIATIAIHENGTLTVTSDGTNNRLPQQSTHALDVAMLCKAVSLEATIKAAEFRRQENNQFILELEKFAR